LESGIASSSIDSAALAFGFPMGPLRLLDEIGLDVSRDIAQTLAGHFPSRIAVPASLNYLVASGQLGRKKGAGYYLYNDPKPVPNPALSLAKPAGRAPDYADTTLRLLAPLLNESVRCLEEKVAAAPHDIDLAMLLGTGFPAHHGGPMRYLDYCGAAKMVGRMNKLAASVHPRFEPCDLLKLKAKNKESFYDELV
jgi:3-hydroxyacyl-CoA dehydrogenase/enoyl-CoA hydratase/3-hydroxybutyryl-CoA epimerase